MQWRDRRTPWSFLGSTEQSVFAWRFALRGDSLTVSSVVRLRGMTGVSALCSMAERAFVLGIALPAASSELVHRVGQDGEVQSSFGEAFGPPGEVSRILFGTGRLLCLPQEQLIVVASQYFPEVRAYDVRGTLRWRQQLPDFRRVSYRESASRVDYTYPPDSIWDQTVSVFPANDQLLAVQVGRRYGRNPSAPFREVRTLLISMGDGRLIRAQTDLPVVKAAGRGRLFSIDNDGSLSILSYMIR